MPSLSRLIHLTLTQRVNGLGLGLFRIAFALVALQEVFFLFYFRHLIFDPMPYVDRASPVVHLLLMVWMGALICLAVGYQTQRVAVLNYIFWVVFVIFTPMWQDFDGGFDQLMTGSSLLLIFLPVSERLALDGLRARWSEPGRVQPPPAVASTIPLLALLLPLMLSLGLLYFDSGIHKLSAPFWRHGLGAWLPSTMPYYMSPLDLSPLLDRVWLERAIGYAVMAFQLLFIFLFWIPPLKLWLLALGVAFHTGIIVSLNVYPFGFAMLVHYFLLVPPHLWDRLEAALRYPRPRLQVYYDEACPLCRRTVRVLQHFDIRRGLEFLGLAEEARHEPRLASINPSELLKDLYSLDSQGALRKGYDTYLAILSAMGYPALLGMVLGLPGLRWLGRQGYRYMADRRLRESCDTLCAPQPPEATPSALSRFQQGFAKNPEHLSRRLSRLLIGVLLLQLNSTLHYGVFYRWSLTPPDDPLIRLLDQASDQIINLSHAFLGISPHALYLHDHFDHYNRIVALCYQDPRGEEIWLPFVNSEGRLIAPNWGRVQSMWANVAITSHMSFERLERYSRKVTAYYAREMGIDLSEAVFLIKEKRVEVPTDWVPQLRSRNLAGGWQPLASLRYQHGVGHLTLLAPSAIGNLDRRDRLDPPGEIPPP